MAGPRPATTVTTTPTSRATIAVRVSKTVPVVGRSMPIDSNRAFRPLARK
jgi:hypothetical protein